MMTRDLIFKEDDFVFSYRIAGILIRDRKILLQKPIGDEGYSIPGGHVSFGETSEQALIREFREEIGADIATDRLILVGENYFPWGDRPCQQIGLYYTVSLRGEGQIPLEGAFPALDDAGKPRDDLLMHWIPLDALDDMLLYPTNILPHIRSIPEHPIHFIYRQ